MNLDIIEYLNSNGIIVGEENFPRIKNKKKEWNVKNQISLIIEVQKILKGKKSYIIPRIESSIGHEIESFIVQTKRISKMIKLYEEKYYKDDFDYFIIEEGNKILARANRTINALDEDMYLKLILRSMNNYEICLGKVDEGNLKKDGMIICIRSTRYISSRGELSRKDNSLCFRKDGKNVYIPIENTREIYCLNEVSINTKLLDYLSQNHIIVHFFNYYEGYSGTFYPKDQYSSGKLMIKQVKAF